MKNFLKNQYLQLLRKQGIKGGIVPVKNPENEGERLAEVKRLGIMELDLCGERRYNSMTQVATYLTGCAQRVLSTSWDPVSSSVKPILVLTCWRAQC